MGLDSLEVPLYVQIFSLKFQIKIIAHPHSCILILFLCAFCYFQLGIGQGGNSKMLRQNAGQVCTIWSAGGVNLALHIYLMKIHPFKFHSCFKARIKTRSNVRAQITVLNCHPDDSEQGKREDTSGTGGLRQGNFRLRHQAPS